jgi:hypothetical protein
MRGRMIVERIDTLFRAPDTADALSGQRFQSELQTDFQDHSGIENVIKQNDNIRSDHTTLEHTRIISNKLSIAPKQEDFKEKLVEKIIILAPAEDVRLLLFNIKEWLHFLPHVLDVRLNYDDGLYQEFTMGLRIDTDKTVSVRSVRRCHSGQIAFFNPEPAGFLEHHCGKWLTRSLARNVTHLTAIQCWRRSTKSETQMPARNGMSSKQRVFDLLRQHARMELTLLKNSLECAEMIGTPSL